MTGKREALIVANGSYEDAEIRPLKAPPRDAEALGSILRDNSIGGFDDVKILQDGNSYEVTKAIGDFFADRKNDDTLLLYFSGHGMKDDDNKLYFATKDTRPGRLLYTAVASDFVNKIMADSRSRSQVLILDCCYSGAFDPNAKGGEELCTKAQFEGGRGKVVLTASSSIQPAFEDESSSIFTGSLIKGLKSGEADRDHDGRVSHGDLYDYVSEHVKKIRPNMTPKKWEYDMEGDIIIASNPSPSPVKLPPDLQEMIESNSPVKRRAAIGPLVKLLKSDHKGLKLAAKTALDRLAEDRDLGVADAAARALASEMIAGIMIEPSTIGSCPSCGERPLVGDRYCGNCGTDLSSKKCKNCGSLSGQSDAYCGGCGMEIR